MELVEELREGTQRERGGIDNEPERRLLEAILQDAIECWQACAVVAATWQVSGYSQLGRRQRNYYEADFWFFGQYDNAPYFSFTKICDCLGIDPEFIRRQLREWRESQIERTQAEACATLRTNTSEALPSA